MATPHVAVVTVTYKSAAVTIACLKSIEQERSICTARIRVLVFDNASEHAPAIAAAIGANGWDPWVTLVIAPRNGGFAYGNTLGMNQAFRQAVPDFVYLLNPDTDVPPGVIMHISGQSTSVTDHDLQHRRLPGYGFESRRRYFAVTFGLGRSVAIDIAAIVASLIGVLKRLVLGRTHLATSHFTGDLFAHSIIWPRNRAMLPFRGVTRAHSAP